MRISHTSLADFIARDRSTLASTIGCSLRFLTPHPESECYFSLELGLYILIAANSDKHITPPEMLPNKCNPTLKLEDSITSSGREAVPASIETHATQADTNMITEHEGPGISEEPGGQCDRSV